MEIQAGLAGGAAWCAAGLIQSKHGLEDRHVGWAPCHAKSLHELGEGEVSILQGTQESGAHRSKHLQ